MELQNTQNKQNSSICYLEVCDCTNIKGLKVKSEKTKITIQGSDYCKIYEKTKGLNLDFNEKDNKLTASFCIDFLKEKLSNQSRYRKFLKVIRECIEYNKVKNNMDIWNEFITNSKQLDLDKLNSFEKNIKYKNHTLYSSDIINLNDSIYSTSSTSISTYCLSQTDTQIKLEKKSDLELSLKSNGGIIFDYDNNFILKFNAFLADIKNSVNKNILISDILPKQESNLNFTFKHIKNIKKDLSLATQRLIIYYPTKDMIAQLIKLIENKLEKPRIIWLVFPAGGHMNDNTNFNEILNILFWSTEKDKLKTFNHSICSLKCGEKKPEKTNSKIILEKVKYKLNEFEEQLLDTITSDSISILDKLYFYNLGEKPPDIIYECRECPICDLDFAENKDCISYMPCGHMFCSYCTMSTIKIKNCCPSCRKLSKFNGIIIPNLVSSKMDILKKILGKIVAPDDNKNVTLIYTDTFTLSKKLMVYFNELENKKGNENNCNIVNQKTSTNKRDNETILLCPIDKDYLCQNIKRISNVIVLTTTSDYALKSESLGYDYCHGNSDVKLWLFECIS